MSLGNISVEGLEIQDLSSLHNYRTEIPNIIFHMKLDPWLFKAYCVFKMTAGDHGACFKSNNTLSDEIGCSVPTLIKLKNELMDHGLIEIVKRKHSNGGDMPDLIRIVDMWPQNMEHMLKLYPKNPENDHFMFVKGGKRGLGGGVNAVNGGTKPGLDKQDIKEQDIKRTTTASAAVPLKKNEEEKKPEVYPCLQGINIPIQDRIEITKKYSLGEVMHAVKWALHPETKLNKGLVQAIKWACKAKPEIPINPESQILKNNAYALKYDGMKSGSTYISADRKQVMIIYSASQKEPFCLKYDAKGFFDQFTNALRKNNFRILEA